MNSFRQGERPAVVRLAPGRERSLEKRHPWIFDGAVARIEGKPDPGDAVEVVSSKGKSYGVGQFSLHSSIRVRMVSWTPGQTLDRRFWRQRIRAALDRRMEWQEAGLFDGGASNGAMRLVFSEADGIPGFVADRYGEYLSVKALTAGADRHERMLAESLVEELEEICPIRGVVERDDSARKRERLPACGGLLWGEGPDGPVEIHEGPVRMLVDLERGHKTGGYLDQALNRRDVGALCAGARVLNVFSYTGGFGLHALAGGAEEVVNLDVSADAQELGTLAVERSGLDAGRWRDERADAFEALRVFREEDEEFDLIVLDPPKFAPTKKAVARAARGYKDINMLAMQILRPGGLLATFSCSGNVGWDLFQKILFGAALDAGRSVRVLRRFGQAPDHPVLLEFPESEYLRGFLLSVE